MKKLAILILFGLLLLSACTKLSINKTQAVIPIHNQTEAVNKSAETNTTTLFQNIYSCLNLNNKKEWDGIGSSSSSPEIEIRTDNLNDTQIREFAESYNISTRGMFIDSFFTISIQNQPPQKICNFLNDTRVLYSYPALLMSAHDPQPVTIKSRT